MENRSGLVVDACLTPADGHGERIAALAMIKKRADRPIGVTLGADKGYDTADFVNELRAINVRPHVAQNTSRRTITPENRISASTELQSNHPQMIINSLSAKSVVCEWIELRLSKLGTGPQKRWNLCLTRRRGPPRTFGEGHPGF